MPSLPASTVSICRDDYSFWHWFVGQHPLSILRYTNFVELMAPTFTTKFLNTTVRETLTEAYTGWGLDFVWPFLLKFPRDKIAIVDSVCLGHKDVKEGRKRVYSTNMPRNEYEEKDFQLEKWGYNEESLKPHGMTYWVPVEFSSVPLQVVVVCCCCCWYCMIE